MEELAHYAALLLADDALHAVAFTPIISRQHAVGILDLELSKLRAVLCEPELYRYAQTTDPVGGNELWRMAKRSPHSYWYVERGTLDAAGRKEIPQSVPPAYPPPVNASPFHVK